MSAPRSRRAILVALALVAALAIPAGAQAASTAAVKHAQTRYSLVHGCYSLTSANGRPLAGANQIRMQATALGRYLLYRPDRTFLAVQDDGKVSPADAPSTAADWRVRRTGKNLFSLSPLSASDKVLSVGGDGSGQIASAAAAGNAAQIRFAKASGCAVYPEAALDTKGK